LGVQQNLTTFIFQVEAMRIIREEVDQWMATYNRGPLAALHQLLLSIEGVKATEQPPPKKRKKFRTDEEKKKQKKKHKKNKKKKKDNVVRIRLKTCH